MVIKDIASFLQLSLRIYKHYSACSISVIKNVTFTNVTADVVVVDEED